MTTTIKSTELDIDTIKAQLKNFFKFRNANKNGV